MCKLSIVTINYNNAGGLQKTIESVNSQTFKDVEYIIIDGCSTDTSVEVIKKYKDHLTYWVSEKDKGIYHAMNKGINIARGEYLLMLNSGDVFTSNVILENVFTGRVIEADIIYADVLWNINGKNKEERHPDKLTFQYFRHNFLCHQSVFIRRLLHHSVGMYDERLKIIADWKFEILAMCKYNATYLHVPLFSVQCEWGGLSKRPESWEIVLAERKQTLEQEFPGFLPDYLAQDKIQRELDDLNRTLYIRVRRRLSKIFQNMLNPENNRGKRALLNPGKANLL
jgi:glycosyltransferase involved in cell wall biosynthesis